MRRLKASIKICPLKECLILILFSKEIKLLLSTLCVIPFFYTNVRVFFLRTKIENLADKKWSADPTLVNTDVDPGLDENQTERFLIESGFNFNSSSLISKATGALFAINIFVSFLFVKQMCQTKFCKVSINQTTKKYLVHLKQKSLDDKDCIDVIIVF
jgi:hypothetical protein